MSHRYSRQPRWCFNYWLKKWIRWPIFGARRRTHKLSRSGLIAHVHEYFIPQRAERKKKNCRNRRSKDIEARLNIEFAQAKVFHLILHFDGHAEKFLPCDYKFACVQVQFELDIQLNAGIHEAAIERELCFKFEGHNRCCRFPAMEITDKQKELLFRDCYRDFSTISIVLT